MAVTRSRRVGRVLPGTTPRNDQMDTGGTGTSPLGPLDISNFVRTQVQDDSRYLPPTKRAELEAGRGSYYAANPFAVPGVTGESETEDFEIPGIDWGGISLGGGGGSRVPTSYYDALARAAESNAATTAARLALEQQKADLSREQAQALLARQQQGAAAQKAYLESQLGAGVPKEIADLISGQQTTGEEYIRSTAENLLRDLQARQAQGETLSRTGYSNLMNYLARNQPTAFAQAQRAMPAVTESQLGQYMAGQGVSPAAAQEAATLANIQAAGGASNYNQLLNVLAAREAAGQTSRQAEAEMGLATQLAQLQGLYGAATGGLEQSRLSALADLANRISAARLQAQREAAARDQAIQDAIASLLASGLVPGGTTPGGTTPGGTTPGGTVPGGTVPGGTAPGAAAAPARPIDALAARMAQAEAAGNNRLANRIEDFIAANPNAGINRIAREFPQIAETIRNTQVPTPYSAPATNFPLMGFE